MNVTCVGGTPANCTRVAVRSLVSVGLPPILAHWCPDRIPSEGEPALTASRSRQSADGGQDRSTHRRYLQRPVVPMRQAFATSRPLPSNPSAPSALSLSVSSMRADPCRLIVTCDDRVIYCDAFSSSADCSSNFSNEGGRDAVLQHHLDLGAHAFFLLVVDRRR